MIKEELINAVLKNPVPALQYVTLTCMNNGDHGRLEYQGEEKGWKYISYGHGSDFFVIDQFVEEVIWNHRQQLWKLYK